MNKKRLFLFFVLLLASCFLAPKTSTAETKKVRILVVAGHDNEFWGTQYKNLKEADLNAQLAQYLIGYLEKNPRYHVFSTRNKDGYFPFFENYFIEHETEIKEYKRNKRTETVSKIEASIIQVVNGVPHNSVNEKMAVRLYGINKYATDNNIDLVIHVHFNDYGGRKYNTRGEYRGFSVYVPEKQLQNAVPSMAIGKSIYGQLKKHFLTSELPEEYPGLVEDQKLIALGANNSLKSASILIEYGYIYQTQFTSTKTRASALKSRAYQTYLGLENFFKKNKI